MREHKVLSKNAYDQKANNYEDTFDGKFTVPFKDQLIEEIEIQKNDTVLDVACGTGSLLNQLLQLHDFQAYGIDISKNMIEVAKNRYPNIKFQVSDSESMQFDNEFFNVITVCAAFHHFPNPQQFINEATRLLAKGGHIYIAEVYLPPVTRHISNIFIPLSNSGDVKIYSYNEILKMFKRANLTDFKITRKAHVQIISAKK